MNIVQNAVATVGLISAITVLAYGAESRYVQKEEYRNLQWVLMKKELRELRAIRDEHPSRRTEDAYQELLEAFCYHYPNDRECDER
jgi:hypothetical protein